MASIAGSLHSRRHDERGSEAVPGAEEFSAAPEFKVVELWSDADDGRRRQSSEVIQVEARRV